MRYISALIIVFMYFPACTVTTENPPDPIVFGEAVGNYKGSYIFCTSVQQSARDSICQSAVQDIFRISIADKNHIRVRSENGNIAESRIPFVERKTTGSGSILLFKLYTEQLTQSVEIYTQTRQMEFVSKQSDTTPVKIHIFKGAQ
ncbi:MAG: hypothetical protein IPM26_01585 [Saprospiraceae bacterium]|nr:hypothetical protein [Saprospiraceae bacterium]